MSLRAGLLGRLTVLATVGLLVLGGVACSAQAPSSKGSETASVSAPSTKILYQPRFTWGDGEVTHQGTGFVTSGPDRKPFAITSSHFLDFTGHVLRKADGSIFVPKSCLLS